MPDSESYLISSKVIYVQSSGNNISTIVFNDSTNIGVHNMNKETNAVDFSGKFLANLTHKKLAVLIFMVMIIIEGFSIVAGQSPHSKIHYF